MQSSQPLSKFQLQQQLILQAQQNLSSQSVNDLERRKLRMLLNNQNLGLGKDGHLSSGDVLGNFGSPMQVNSPTLSRGDTDLLIKVFFFRPLCLVLVNLIIDLNWKTFILLIHTAQKYTQFKSK